MEQSSDEDIIRMSTAGSERITIDDSGNTRIGDGTNNTYIEADGSLSFEGSATRFDDLTIPVTSTKTGGAKEPGFAQAFDNGSGSQGVYLYWFSGSTEEELFFTVQIPHARKYNTEIFPHVHFVVPSGYSSGNIVWGLEYNWANLGDTFTNTNIIYASTNTSLVGGPLAGDKHMLASFAGNGTNGGIDGSGKTLSVCWCAECLEQLDMQMIHIMEMQDLCNLIFILKLMLKEADNYTLNSNYFLVYYFLKEGAPPSFF